MWARLALLKPSALSPPLTTLGFTARERVKSPRSSIGESACDSGLRRLGHGGGSTDHERERLHERLGEILGLDYAGLSATSEARPVSTTMKITTATRAIVAPAAVPLW